MSDDVDCGGNEGNELSAPPVFGVIRRCMEGRNIFVDAVSFGGHLFAKIIKNVIMICGFEAF